MASLYRLLLRLLPRRLRARHGAEMERLFAERVSASRAGGGRGVAAALAGYWDVLRRALYERVRRPAAESPERVSNLGADMRFALRTFVRRPGLTLVAVLMLALGVASTTAVFTVVEGLFLRPLPFPAPDRLVYIDETAPSWNLELVGVDFADFVVWREGQRAFEAIGLIDQGSFNLSSGDAVERVQGARVTYDLAAALGVTPVLGRGFTADDDRPGAAPVVMLGHELWRRQFGGSPAVIGQTVRLNSEPHTVVGVLPPEASYLRDTELWTPLAADPTARGSYSYAGVGRLRAGVTVEAGESDLRRAHQPVWEEHDEERVVSPVVMPLRERLVGDLTGVAVALAVAVGLVLLIACANVASILVARSVTRGREFGIRAALGAGSRRIARQLFGESLALALVAGPLGLVLGFWLVRLLAARLPDGLPGWVSLDPSWRMALFGLALILGTTVLFGWAPVIQARRTDVRDALGDGSGRVGASKGQRRMLNALVVGEVTLAALLLVSGGLLLRSFQRLQDVDPGYRTENVLRFRIALPEATYPDSAARGAFYDGLVADLAALPAVRAAGGIDCPPLGCHTGGFFSAEDGLGTAPDDANPVVLYRRATPGYFEAMGIEAASGRLLEPDDDRSGQRVVVINETFAR
ncbi:MAG TPA: ABC transporter permease, partial [Longimicrobiales bacterium]|nr:ABC transporter permease [Longimicrobiales bacterium]